MPAFAPNLGPAQEPWCVAGGNPDQAREAKPDIMFRDFFPPAGATENPEPQQVKSIDHENAAGPGVANPQFGFRRFRRAEGGLDGEQPEGDKKGKDEETLVGAIARVGPINGKPEPELNQESEPEGNIAGVHS